MSNNKKIFEEIEKIGLSYGYLISMGQSFTPSLEFLKGLCDYFGITFEKSRLLLWAIEHDVLDEYYLKLDNRCAYQIVKLMSVMTDLELINLMQYEHHFLKLKAINRALRHGVSFQTLVDHGLLDAFNNKWYHTHFVVECLINNYNYQVINYLRFSKKYIFLCLEILKMKKPLYSHLISDIPESRYKFVLECLNRGISYETIALLKNANSFKPNMLDEPDVQTFIKDFPNPSIHFANFWADTRKNAHAKILFDYSKIQTYDKFNLDLIRTILNNFSESEILKIQPYIKEFCGYNFKKVAPIGSVNITKLQ